MIEKRKKGSSNIEEPQSPVASGEQMDDRKDYLRATSLVSLVLSVLLVLIFVFYFGKDDGGASIALTTAPVRISQAGRPAIPHNDVTLAKKLAAIEKPSQPPVLNIAAPAAEAPSPQLKKLTEEANAQIEKIRKMKQGGMVMEKDPEALQEIAVLQKQLQTLIPLKYGPGPYQVEMTIQFPESMLTDPKATVQETILIDMAPISLVPYCVYYFLEIVSNWKGGAFHRNAGHVLQAQVRSNMGGLAFQEYHPDFPHNRYTLGYAGRPGGPAFYISTLNNVGNHGPGSQGSKTEADGCFGKIANQKGIDVVKRMSTQPGGQKGLGFIIDPKNNIKIVNLKLVKSH